MTPEMNVDMSVIEAYALEYGMSILGALAIFIIGKWAAKLLTSGIRRAMTRANVDATIVSFAGNIIYGIALAFVVIAMLSNLGIETTSLAAIIAAAGLAIGLALQGSLSNFAAGVMVILFRPFKIGDFIEAAGTSGTVKDISIFTTTLKTPDNKTIIVPNSNITSDNITNFSTEKQRRIDMVVGVSYNDDLQKVTKVLEKIVESDERILKDPAVTIAVSELADSSVNFVVRPWVASSDFWAVKFDLTQRIKETFDKEGISIPFPQQDVYMHSVNDNLQAKAA